MAPIWHAFAPPSYVPPFPEISDYSGATNPSRVPDFSEFKDPWEEYSPRNDPFSTDNSSLSEGENCYCGVKYEEKADAVRQSDHSTIQFAHNQQVHREQQHSSYTPTQTYNQHREDATSYSRENRNQEHSVQHSEHYHWQQHSEQRHLEQWAEQRHHHVQHQHHEHTHHNEQQHHNDQRQYNEHHQQFHQHDHRNKADDHHQHQLVQELQPAEVRHESHIQYHTGNNQASHQNAGHLSHIVSHNESHTQHNNQGPRDNFAFHYRSNEKTSEQALEAANKQTDTRRIDFLPPSPTPCTDLPNVAMRSDPNVTEHLDNANVSNCSHILFFSKFKLNILSLYVRFRTYENMSALFR